MSSQAKLFDLQLYRQRRSARAGDVEVAAASVASVANYGATSVAPFAVPMAFFAFWPVFVFPPLVSPVAAESEHRNA